MNRLAALLCVCIAFASANTMAEPVHTVYVQFIRGTDQPCNGCREIGPKLSRKLSPVFRWKHFWELDRKKLAVRQKNVTRIEVPGDRKLEIQFTKSDEIEIRLSRRTGLVTKARYQLNHELCVLGGEENNRESFFVVVRQDEPSND